MRAAFTIVFNGLHHLKHNSFAERMAKQVDLWVVVEGPAGNSGSTNWCRTIPARYMKGCHSSDGTLEYLKELQAEHTNVRVVIGSTAWPSKDAMVNAAIAEVKKHTDSCYLWQVDVDEQWEKEAMADAEHAMEYMGADCGEFLCEYFVGESLIACGEWGEGKRLPYRRLWRWKGQLFATHEPPELSGGNGERILLPPTFMHYAYYFPQDVEFKELYYTGHEGIYGRWLDLQAETDFPQPIGRLITGPWGRTRTEIVRVRK